MNTSIHNVKLDDVSLLDKDRNSLIGRCIEVCNVNYTHYKSYDFAFSTGFCQTVDDEINLILESNKDKYGIYFEKDIFVAFWGLEKYLHYKINDLSGGWQKFLGVALFTNNKSQGKIYMDACSQLSDRLIKLLIDNLKKLEIEFVFFIEYDMHLLDKFNLKQVYFNLQVNKEDDFREETNY